MLVSVNEGGMASVSVCLRKIGSRRCGFSACQFQLSGCGLCVCESLLAVPIKKAWLLCHIVKKY